MQKFNVGDILLAQAIHYKNDLALRVTGYVHSKDNEVIGYSISQLNKNHKNTKLRDWYELHILDCACKLHPIYAGKRLAI